MSTYPVESQIVTEFTWDYADRRPALAKLYEKGKTSQWNATTDIDWSPEVNFGEARPQSSDGPGLEGIIGFAGGESPIGRLDDAGRTQFRWEFQSWMVSQFMHGEQGALVATARLVETVPDLDAKFYAANQAADEARHVEAYARYLNEKLRHSYPISDPLKALLTDIMSESRWDITYLGMQIMVEGLALAAFGLGNVMFQDPIIRQITDYVMRDEARHVAFGVLSLQGLYDDMDSAELADREEFVMDAAQLMRDRFLLDDVWERVGIDVQAGKEFALHNPLMGLFRQMLFSKIVPNLNKLGLLTDRVRPHFEQLGILQLADLPDSTADADEGLSTGTG
ncbi:MAG TPA: ferritin-like domain-containing protein [Acidimicrobiales bacterium]|nr:ferritin-like domain-containing protein [Acidimicrobiales bacterium]